MEKLRDHRVFLEMLIKSNAKYRKSLLAGAPPEIIQILGECALNILQGIVTLTKEEKTKLRQHKHDLRKMANSQVSQRTKKKIIQEGGGLVPAMLKPVLKALIPVLASQIIKRL